jgi:Zn-finger nucleic acid-binding protein
MKCPVSGEEMQTEVREGVTLDRSAAGIWLDKKELFLLTEAERAKPVSFFEDLFRKAERPPVDRHRVLACPHCGADMEIVDYVGVHIDRCRAHGVFLDSGELGAILNNLRTDPAYVRGIAQRLSDMKL